MNSQNENEGSPQINMIEQQASQQLTALAEVSDHLESAGIAYWLFGGWAVDFYVGSVTRLHDDLDLAVWLLDTPKIARLLQGDHWHHAPFDDEDGGTGYERDGVRLELTYLVRGFDGFASIPLRTGLVVWPGEEGLADDVGVLCGVRSHLIGFASLIAGKSAPRDDPKDAAKDHADFTQLSQLQA
jgi:hypothetical protein